jgi:hypothetical protein
VIEEEHMDPNETLRRIRALSERIVAREAERAEDDSVDGSLSSCFANLEAQEDDAVELAELTHALDEWLTKGGFLPTEWHR